MDRQAPNAKAILRILLDAQVEFVVVGSVAAAFWGADVGIPGDLDIVPAMTHENLTRLMHALGRINGTPFPAVGCWVLQGSERVWESFSLEDPRYAQVPTLDPVHGESFDTLVHTRYGTLDIVPELSGVYHDLKNIAPVMKIEDVGACAVMSLEDLLNRLTVPRREKDAPRVQQLRSIQRQMMLSKE